jgi:hypothetical protein
LAVASGRGKDLNLQAQALVNPKLFRFGWAKTTFARIDRFVYLPVSDPAATNQPAQLQVDLSLEPDTLRRH